MLMGLRGFATVAELARDLGYDRSEKLARLMRSPDAAPSADIIGDVANKYVNLNLKWWLTGQDQPTLDYGDRLLTQDDLASGLYKTPNPAFARRSSGAANLPVATAPPPGHDNAEEGNIIILDSKVAAGALQHYDQAERLRGQERMSLPWLSGSGLLAVQVDGDSMEPTILGGDWLVIRRLADPLHEIRAGHVYVITSHNKALAKRLHVDRAGHAILCKSDNPAHADIRIKDERPVVYDVLALLREGVGDQRHNMQARLLRVEQEVEKLKARKG